MQLNYETRQARGVRGNWSLLALPFPCSFREAFPSPRVPPPADIPPAGALPAARRGSEVPPPKREPRYPSRSLAAEAVSAARGGASPVERNLMPAPLRVPSFPSPRENHLPPQRGLRPFISPALLPPTVSVPLTSPRGKLFKLYLLSPTPRTPIPGANRGCCGLRREASCGLDLPKAAEDSFLGK